MPGSLCRRLSLALALSTAAASIGTVASNAEGVPPQLRGKTITAAYSESTMLKEDATGRTSVGSRTTTQTVYLSNEGRIFVRLNITTSDKLTKQFDQDPEHALAHFEGGALVSRVAQISGAFQRTIRFSPDFMTCTVSVISGRLQGTPYKYRSNVNGKVYTKLGSTIVSGERCSVAAGNGLQ